MVHQMQSNAQRTTYAPYLYPNFSRYEVPTRIGDDDESYSEPKWAFPHWDDEVDVYSPPIKHHRQRTWETAPDDYFKITESTSTEHTSTTIQGLYPQNVRIQEEEEEEEQESNVCDELQFGIDACRRDQKTDYERFHMNFVTLSEEIRALQRDIEDAEAVCMSQSWKNTSGIRSRASSLASSPIPSISAFGTASPMRTLASSPAAPSLW